MKSLYLSLLFSACFAFSSKAQNTFPASGSVGLGTTTPQDLLHLQNGSVLVKHPQQGVYNNFYPLIYGTQHSAGTSGYAGVYLFENGSGGFGQASGLGFRVSTLDMGTNTNLAMLISGAGNVSLGGGYPVEYTNMTSLSLRNNNGGGIITFQQNNALQGQLWNDGTNFNVMGATGAGINFWSDGNIKMLLNTAGDLKLNTGSLYFAYGNSSLNSDQGGSMELGNSTGAGTAPYVDFHYGKQSAQDYNVRLMNTADNQLQFRTAGNGTVMTLNGANLGIGTTQPDQKLTVNGTIHATKVLIEATVPGPDYVFENSYRLRSLAEVAAYIKANKHLPEVPSAKEMKNKGVDVNEMNFKLLQKVEELTRYLIEQDKQMKAQEQRIKELEKQVNKQ